MASASALNVDRYEICFMIKHPDIKRRGINELVNLFKETFIPPGTELRCGSYIYKVKTFKDPHAFTISLPITLLKVSAKETDK